MSHAFSEFDKKVEEAKGAEYYILGDDLSEQLVKRLSFQIHNTGIISGHRTTGPELLKFKYERDDYYGISKEGHVAVQVKDRYSWDYNKYVCEEQMPEEFSGEDRDTGIVHRYKRASRGIVSVNGLILLMEMKLWMGLRFLSQQLEVASLHQNSLRCS
jgi:hypothetical protein